MSYLGLVMTAPCYRAQGAALLSCAEPFPGRELICLAQIGCSSAQHLPEGLRNESPVAGRASLGEPEGSLCSALLFAMSHPPPPGLFLAEWES